jgi:hypothetical protein
MLRVSSKDSENYIMEMDHFLTKADLKTVFHMDQVRLIVKMAKQLRQIGFKA